MARSSIIDCYQCIVEPPDLWAARVPAAFRDRAPRVVDAPEGGNAWSFEDGATMLPLSHLMMVEPGPQRPVLFTSSYGTMRPGCYDAKQRVADMNADGLDVGLVFPIVGGHLHRIQDPELHKACVEAYNDALVDWCKAGDASRLIPVAIMPLLDVDAAVMELDRVLKTGYKAVLFSGWPNGSPSPDAADDQFWKLCEESQIVVCFNSGAIVREQASSLFGGSAEASARVVARAPVPITLNNLASGVGAPLAVGRLVLRGVTERFPRLKLCFSGTGAGWLPYFLEQVDGMYFHDRFYAEFNFPMLPSEYLRRNTKLTFHVDHNAVKNLDDIGAENLMWASHYPLESSDWPDSRSVIDSQLRDVADADRRLILEENAKDYFGLSA